MSEMTAAVLLRLHDELSAPARKAAASVKSLVKDLERLKSLSGKTSGVNRQMQGMVRELKSAQKAAQGLRREMGRTVPNGFRRASEGIERVRTEARSATRAVAELEARLRRGGSFNGRVNAGGGGGHGARSGGHGSHGILAHTGRHMGRHVLGSTAGFAFAALGGEVAEGIVESVRSGMEQSFEKAHTQTMLKMQGESAGDIAAAVAQSQKMAQSLPSFTSAQHLEAIAELRPALVGGLQEATKLAPMMQQAVAVLEATKQGAGGKALSGVNTHGEALELVRALEVGGITTHQGWTDQRVEDNMRRYVNGITKSIVGMNGQIGAKDFHSAFKGSRGDSVNWSAEFATEILPTLMNELKASKFANSFGTGNALKSMSRVVMDGVMGKDIAARWDALGMFAPGAMTKTKQGLKRNPKDTGGAMLGASVWQENPYQWVQDYLLPHMREHGIDVGDRKAVVASLGGLFGNRVANHIAQILAIQQAQIKKDQDNIRKATGTSGLDFLMNADPTMRMQVFAASLKELGSAIGDLALPGVMRGMKGIIDWAHSAAATLQNSAYAKKLGGYYEAAIAGIFGQSMGRKGLMGRNPEYYGAGKALGAGWSHFTSSMGKMLRFWEDVGLFSGSLKAAGIALDAIGTASDTVRGALESFRAALKSDFVTGVVRAFTDGIAPLTKLISDAFGPEKSYGDIRKEQQAAAASIPKAPEPQKPQNIVKLPAMVRAGSPLAAKQGKVVGVTADPLGVDGIIQRVKKAATEMQNSGANLAGGLAAGIQSGSGKASGAMSALMSNLAATAEKGIKVPVSLDTTAAQAQLSALLSKSLVPSLKSATPVGPFSKGYHENFN